VLVNTLDASMRPIERNCFERHDFKAPVPQGPHEDCQGVS
jgi:hypothetical protein